MNLTDPGCAWCSWSEDNPRWPDCSCRELCDAAHCLPGFPAADVTPGMAVHHPAASGVLDVISVSGPDDDGWVCLASLHETVRVEADWRVSLYTPGDADLTAFRRLAGEAA